MRIRRRLGGLAVPAALVLALVGACAEDDEPDPPPPTAAPGLADLVPAEISADGTITVATDGDYPPNEFLDEDGVTVVGWDIDLFDAVAGALGLTTEYVIAPFGTIVAGVTSGQYEVGVSSFTINQERLAEVNMVSYFNAGTQWAAPAGTAVDPDDACGLRVAVQRDTVQVEDLEAKSQDCVGAGQPEITIQQYPEPGAGHRHGGLRAERRHAGRLPDLRVRRAADRGRAGAGG